MRTLRYAMLVALGAALFAASALAAPTKSIPIAGKYAGTASTQNDNNTVTIAANGKGALTTLGAGTIVGNGTGDSSQQPCVPFAGTGTMKGVGGTITYRVPTGSTACGDEGGHTFSVKGTFVVLKATGKLAKAKGSLRFTGGYSRDDGTWNIKVAGTLKR